MTRELPILVQRTAVEAYQKCHRLRWWGYEAYKGVDILTLELPNVNENECGKVHIGGVVPNKPVWPLAVGSGVHAGVEYLLRAAMSAANNSYSLKIENTLITAVHEALQKFDQEVMPYFQESTSLNSGTNGDEDSQLTPYKLGEQRALVEALVRAWALAPMGLAWLLEEYEILAVEQEITCPLILPGQVVYNTARTFNIDQSYIQESTCSECEGAGFRRAYAGHGNINEEDCETCAGTGIIAAAPMITESSTVMLMARPDAILRHRSSGGIYVWSLKTTKAWDKKKQQAGDYDIQGLSELIATEWWLQNNAGNVGVLTSIAGIQMTYLIKGDNRQDKLDNQYKVSNGLIRPYFKPGSTSEDDSYKLKYEWLNDIGETKRLGKGWNRIDLWDIGTMEIAENVARFAQVDDSGVCPLDDFVVNPMPYFRNEGDVTEWIAQTIAQEQRITDGLVYMNTPNQSWTQETLKAHVLTNVFPKYRHACQYPTPCPYIPLCHEGADSDILGSGMYKLRTANHPQEVQETLEVRETNGGE